MSNWGGGGGSGPSSTITQAEVDALAGTSGAPSGTNEYVTDQDPRLKLGAGTIVNHTSSAILTSAVKNTIHTNSGAGSIILTLPAGVAGEMYGFHLLTAANVTIQAPSSTTIRLGGSVSSSAGSVSTSSVGAHLMLIAFSATVYDAIVIVGTWGTPV